MRTRGVGGFHHLAITFFLLVRMIWNFAGMEEIYTPPCLQNFRSFGPIEKKLWLSGGIHQRHAFSPVFEVFQVDWLTDWIPPLSHNFFSIGSNDLKFCRHGGVYISSMPAKFQIIRTNRKKVMAKWWNPPPPRVLNCFWGILGRLTDKISYNAANT